MKTCVGAMADGRTTAARCRLGARGFTIIELMIVIAVIAVIAAIAIPNLLASRRASNEAAAVQALRAIHAAQQLFRDRDFDKDGHPNYAGSLFLLAGLLDSQLTTPAPERPFHDASQRSGYWFGIIDVGNDHAGTEFMAMAHPVAMGRSGDRVFVIDESAVIRSSTLDILAGGAEPSHAEIRAWTPIGG